MGGDLRRRRLDRRDVRRAHPAARRARRTCVVVRLRRNFGKAAALAAGFAQARGEVIVTIDGDLQDDPAEIPQLLAKLDEGFDLVSGWKTESARPAAPPGALAGLQRGHRLGLRRPPARHELRPEGLPRRGGARPPALRRAAPVHPGAGAQSRLPGRRAAGQPPPARARPLALRARALPPRASSTCSRVSFIGRYRQRPLHLFGGLGSSLSFAGTAILIYLTIDEGLGHAIGSRPLLILGVLLVVVGIQFFSLGLITELITSHHEERCDERERSEAMVEEILAP